MSLAKEISVRVVRSVIYPPVGVFWGFVAGFVVAIVVLFWVWLVSLFMHFDLYEAVGRIIAVCVGIGAIIGFFVGLWNGIFEEVE